jgi:hypothetical protein
MGKVSCRVARPRNLVRLRKANRLVELLHDIHDSQRDSLERGDKIGNGFR